MGLCCVRVREAGSPCSASMHFRFGSKAQRLTLVKLDTLAALETSVVAGQYVNVRNAPLLGASVIR